MQLTGHDLNTPVYKVPTFRPEQCTEVNSPTAKMFRDCSDTTRQLLISTWTTWQQQKQTFGAVTSEVTFR